VIFNQVAREEDMVGEYVVFARYRSRLASSTVKCTALAQGKCSQGPRTEMFSLPVYQAKVRVVDARGEAVSGASVRFAEATAYTDRNGEAAAWFEDGAAYEASISYGELTRRVSGMMRGDDALHEVTLPLHDLRLRVIDDRGLPLEAMVRLENETKYADANGSVEFRRVPFQNPTAVIEYGGHRKNVSINMSQDVFQTVRIDLGPPALGEPVFARTDGNVLVSVEARDVGVAASGLRMEKPLLITYSPDNRTWVQAEMHVVSAGVFGVTLPASLYPNASFYYRIQAFDNEGNVAEKNGSVGIMAAKPPAPEGGGVNYLYVLGAIIIAIVVVIIYRRIREYV